MFAPSYAECQRHKHFVSITDIGTVLIDNIAFVWNPYAVGRGLIGLATSGRSSDAQRIHVILGRAANAVDHEETTSRRWRAFCWI